MIIRAAVALVLVILIGYGATRAWPLLAGPSLSIASPIDNETALEGPTPVTGIAQHTENLWLNGAPLLIDEDGNFATSLVLPKGGAILSLTATDRFGREITERRTVFVP